MAKRGDRDSRDSRGGRKDRPKGADRGPARPAGDDVPVTRPEHWKDEPDGHDYPAAADYLRLVLGPAEVDALVDALRSAPITRHKAKDLLRASRLALLEMTNPHVAADLAKVAHGDLLSPVLCVRGLLRSDVALTVADGYHRICASYHLDENADIPCKLVDPPGPASRRAPAPRRSQPVA